MKVILTDDIIKLGNAGEIKDVADGYARNHLLPQKLAMPASDANLRKWESEKRVRQVKLQENLSNAQKLADQLNPVALSLVVKAGPEGLLFGSVTSGMVAEALLGKGFQVDKRHIILDSPIKTVGNYTVSIRLHAQVTAKLNLTVLSGAQVQAAAEAAAEAAEKPAAEPAEGAPASTQD